MKTNNSKYRLNVNPAGSPTKEVAHISNFRPESSAHRPETQVTLNWNRLAISGTFYVQDKYVKCVHTEYGDPVYKDSCVEFFVKPDQGAGYFNFEFNAGGAVLAGYVLDPERTPQGGLKKALPFTPGDYKQLKAASSLARIINPETATNTNWELKFEIPFNLLEKFTGPLSVKIATVWEANFYKCADDSSHPHWASWTQLPQKNFHMPNCFGEIIFR